MISVRDRRLQADYEKVRRLAQESGGALVLESTKGKPPDQYIIKYLCRGLASLGPRNSATYSDTHSIQIDLPSIYPGQAPAVKFLKKIFHPHVYESGLMCIGRWTINEQLDQLILRIGAIIQYDPQYINFQSPANRNAAEWAMQNMNMFPLGNITFKKEIEPSKWSVEWTNLK